MASELVYTSSEHGLKPRTQGFCTVAMTPGLNANIIERLEGLSGYRAHFAAHDADAARNPVNFSYYRFRIGGRECPVLSRICFAGFDYTGRSNKLAHHVVLNDDERPRCGPARIAGTGDFFLSSWNGPARWIEGARPVPAPDEYSSPANAWRQATGDAGWAGAVAEHTLAAPANAACVAVILYPPGFGSELLIRMLAEALALIPPDRRWDITFSTYLTDLPTGTTCLWRCMLPDSPEYAKIRRTREVLIIDLTAGPLAPATGDGLVDAARDGTFLYPLPPEVTDPEQDPGPAELPDEVPAEEIVEETPVVALRPADPLPLDLREQPVGISKTPAAFGRPPPRDADSHSHHLTGVPLYVLGGALAAIAGGVVAFVLKSGGKPVDHPHATPTNSLPAATVGGTQVARPTAVVSAAQGGNPTAPADTQPAPVPPKPAVSLTTKPAQGPRAVEIANAILAITPAEVQPGASFNPPRTLPRAQSLGAEVHWKLNGKEFPPAGFVISDDLASKELRLDLIVTLRGNPDDAAKLNRTVRVSALPPPPTNPFDPEKLRLLSRSIRLMPDQPARLMPNQPEGIDLAALLAPAFEKTQIEGWKVHPVDSRNLDYYFEGAGHRIIFKPAETSAGQSVNFIARVRQHGKPAEFSVGDFVVGRDVPALLSQAVIADRNAGSHFWVDLWNEEPKQIGVFTSMARPAPNPDQPLEMILAFEEKSAAPGGLLKTKFGVTPLKPGEPGFYVSSIDEKLLTETRLLKVKLDWESSKCVVEPQTLMDVRPEAVIFLNDVRIGIFVPAGKRIGEFRFRGIDDAVKFDLHEAEQKAETLIKTCDAAKTLLAAADEAVLKASAEIAAIDKEIVKAERNEKRIRDLVQQKEAPSRRLTAAQTDKTNAWNKHRQAEVDLDVAMKRLNAMRTPTTPIELGFPHAAPMRQASDQAFSDLTAAAGSSKGQP